jgi:Rrf2 family protein
MWTTSINKVYFQYCHARRLVIGLTRKCQYAFRALFFLAREYGNGPVRMHDISDGTSVPPEFLRTILLDLKNAGILGCRRGSQGGYFLLNSPEGLSAGVIVRIIDGPLVTLPCVAEREARACTDCRNPDGCQTRLMMRGVHDAVAAILDRTTVAPPSVARSETAVSVPLSPLILSI